MRYLPALKFLLPLLALVMFQGLLGSSLDANQRAQALETRQVKGRILSAKEVRFQGADRKNLVVRLRTNRGHQELIVDLGDSQALKGILDSPVIEVEGRMVKVENKSFLLAKRVRCGDNLIRVNRRNYFGKDL